ncbi:hypothetical protein PV10_04460 [Exophiala mesophila]|uniref:Uncharacterized protein n=1 Tax=Exophiala mesophila TaxID=212818 RepID=A0A0D1WV72_EXOME|nr:uncharacterized protein PV10_04460 [Exophiala mesophila]KIV93230.1 hypothetical protein PV10_04460 [Exophiala mesophila]
METQLTYSILPDTIRQQQLNEREHRTTQNRLAKRRSRQRRGCQQLTTQKLSNMSQDASLGPTQNHVLCADQVAPKGHEYELIDIPTDHSHAQIDWIYGISDLQEGRLALSNSCPSESKDPLSFEFHNPLQGTSFEYQALRLSSPATNEIVSDRHHILNTETYPADIPSEDKARSLDANSPGAHMTFFNVENSHNLDILNSPFHQTFTTPGICQEISTLPCKSCKAHSHSAQVSSIPLSPISPCRTSPAASTCHESRRVSDGKTALHLAAEHGHSSIVRYLLDCGAEIDQPDTVGKTALHHATQNGHSSTVMLLLARGAKPNFLDHTGWTVLHMAAEGGHEHILRLLINAGANYQTKIGYHEF